MLALQVAYGKDAVDLVDLGPSLVCVNPHNFVQRFICMAEVGPAVEHSEVAESDASWFPGYLWIGAFCQSCRVHLVRMASFRDLSFISVQYVCECDHDHVR